MKTFQSNVYNHIGNRKMEPKDLPDHEKSVVEHLLKINEGRQTTTKQALNSILGLTVSIVVGVFLTYFSESIPVENKKIFLITSTSILTFLSYLVLELLIKVWEKSKIGEIMIVSAYQRLKDPEIFENQGAYDLFNDQYHAFNDIYAAVYAKLFPGDYDKIRNLSNARIVTFLLFGCLNMIGLWIVNKIPDVPMLMFILVSLALPFFILSGYAGLSFIKKRKLLKKTLDLGKEEVDDYIYFGKPLRKKRSALPEDDNWICHRHTPGPSA